MTIDCRLSGGVGQTVSLARESSTRFDLSPGIPGERSLPPEASAPGDTTVLPSLNSPLVQMSGRLRYRKGLTARVGVEHSTWYRPELAVFKRCLASSVPALSYSVS